MNTFHILKSIVAGLGLCGAVLHLPAAEPAGASQPSDLTWPNETIDTWHGFKRHNFTVDGCQAWVVEPKQALPGHPWSWCMEFPDAFTDRCAAPALLAKGFYHGHISVGNTFGSPAALKHFDAFYESVRGRGLAGRGVLIGLSRGGLYAYRWASENPQKVAVIYGDAPVCDFKSWPGGKGKGKGSPGDWKELIRCYGFKDEAEALAYRGNPVDTLEVLARNKIALIHVVGDADDVVPADENTALIETRYRQLGGEVQVIHKPGIGHHPHGLEDPAPVVKFIMAHAAKDAMVDLDQVPQIHETPEQRDARLQWWRDAKFGMFMHWGPVSLSGKELGWGREAHRPWDINGVQTPRTSDPYYDNLYKQFNPVKFNADQWAKIAQDAGMRYMVLITKHHDGFSMFDSKLTEYDIMSTPYGRDIVKQFAEACHKAGMKLGLYYSTRDWYHPDYLVGDNAKYDAWYRGQVEELLSHYGKVDIMWFDHVGGHDWGKWRFDQLFAMMYRLQPELVVNNRAARFCGPSTPQDRGPATPEIVKMTDGDFGTPEQSVGHMDLKHDWESCMTLVGGQWSWQPNGKMYSFAETLRILLDCVTGGGNLLLNIGPMPTGEIEPRQVDLLKEVGTWVKAHSEAVYATRGGPFSNGRWGGSTHRGNTVYLHVFEWQGDRLFLSPLPQRVTGARLLPSGGRVLYSQSERGLDLTVPPADREALVTVVELTLDRPVERGQRVGALRSMFADTATYGALASQTATFTMSSPSAHDNAADHAKLFTGERAARGFAFHTGDEANPWIKIDLGGVRNVTGVTVENRPAEPRTQGLTLSLSEDGAAWTTVWKAKTVQDRWDVPVTQTRAGAEVPGRKARYLKLETTPSKRSPLALQRLEVFAKDQ